MDLSKIFMGCPGILDNEKRLRNVLLDYYANDVSKVNRMMRAYEVGVLKVFSGRGDLELEKKKLADRMVSLHDMQEAKAEEAIAEWEKICTKDTAVKYRKYLGAEQNEEAEYNEREGEKLAVNQTVGLNVDYENYDRYRNLDLSKGRETSGIPCGVGNADHGFIVKGTGDKEQVHRDLFPGVQALVYNFLIRDSHITKDAYPQYMKMHRFNRELDYGNIYRFMMILLDLLEPAGETELRLHLIGDWEELCAAVNILNEYLAVFGRLTKSQPCCVKVSEDPEGKSISVTSQADYCVENYDSDQGLSRRVRYGHRINYSLDETDRKDLEFLLREISPFQFFKKGQFEALCSMMNANDHAVCIMPPGSGKSLIYYFACLLQPQAVFVVSPTEILIRDQIRNLRKFHHFDNVTHLELTDDHDFSSFQIAANLIFLTPAAFQSRNLFGIFKQWKKKIAYVVLDEVHFLSNCGHHFRPEYLMLSKNLNRYLDDARYLGFTASTNYNMVLDIQKQLQIPFKNFFAPVLFKKNKACYDFREVDTMEEMYEQVRKVADEIVRRNERAIVFTKSDMISRKVADAIGYEADVFTRNRVESYIQFAEGMGRILVTSEELGVGIHFPNVNCTVHFGMPLSKNAFLQEIGRAGRAEEKVMSYMVYLKASEKNVASKLLKRETAIDHLPRILKTMDNDYAHVYYKLTCGAETSTELYDRLLNVYSYFQNGNKTVYIVSQPVKMVASYKRLIYMLYVTGYVRDWYVYRVIDGGNTVELLVDICYVSDACGHKDEVLDDAGMLERMRKKSRDYFASMGNDRKSMFKVSKAQKIEDILKVYVDWYYEKYLYHRKEQFLDFYAFLKTGT
jgi:superfamily II DNA helicase RecQ